MNNTKGSDINLLHNMGLVYGEMEKYDEAIKWFQKVVEIDPNYYEAWNNLGYDYQQKEIL